MSLESGKKLGLTASLISVIMPITGIVAYILYFISLISTLSRNLLNPTPTSTAVPWLFLIVFGAIGVISFIGVILFIIAMHQLAEHYHERGIFTNAITGFILNIAVTIAVVVALIVEIGSFISTIPTSGTQTAAAISPIQNSTLNFLTQFIIIIIIVAVIGFILAILSAFFYYRAFNKLGEKSGINNFKTAGLLYLIGEILTIVGVGVIILWIAWILAAMGFNSLKSTQTTPTQYTAPTYTEIPKYTEPTTPQTKICPYCGTENKPNAIYCSKCGNLLP